MTTNPLHQAVISGHVHAVQFLLDHEADPNSMIKRQWWYNKRPILHEAVIENNYEIVKLLLESGADPNVEYEDHDKAFMYVKTFEVAKLLVDHGTRFDKNSDKYLKCVLRISAKTAKLLLEKDCKLDCLSQKIIYYYVKCGDVEYTQLFLEKGIDVNRQDNDGNTMLMIAALGNVDKMLLLLHAGANLNIENKCGETALSLYLKNIYSFYEEAYNSEGFARAVRVFFLFYIKPSDLIIRALATEKNLQIRNVNGKRPIDYLIDRDTMWYRHLSPESDLFKYCEKIFS